MKKLNKEIVETMIAYYADFNEVCESIAARIFYLRCPDAEIEEVASIEIIKNTILATISYKKDSRQARYLTIDFPGSYITNESWEKIEEEKAEKLHREKRAFESM